MDKLIEARIEELENHVAKLLAKVNFLEKRLDQQPETPKRYGIPVDMYVDTEEPPQISSQFPQDYEKQLHELADLDLEDAPPPKRISPFSFKIPSTPSSEESRKVKDALWN
jgi:hypothetical protein